MGYDLHITRKADWWDEDGPVIGFDEWKALVLSDPEMRWDGAAEAGTPEGTGMAIWTSYTKSGRDENRAWFDLNAAGDIFTKNPDKEIRVKMFQLAQKLHAKVQGDEGELYDDKGNEIRSSFKRIRSCGFLLGLLLAALVFAILGLVVCNSR